MNTSPAKPQSTNNETRQAKRYNLPSGKQFIQVLETDLLTEQEYIGFLKGNILKYLLRTKEPLLDLQKAQVYLEYLIDYQSPKQQNIAE